MLLNCGVGEDSWESLAMQGDQSSQLKGNQPWIIFGKVKAKVAQSCLTLCDPMDCSIHGILQTRILEWAAVPFSRGSSQPRYQTQVSCIAGGFFTSWATREAPQFFLFFVRTEAAKICHLMKEPTNWKRLMLEKIEGRHRRGWWGWDGGMTSPIQWTWVWENSRRQWRTTMLGLLQSMWLQSWTWLSDWTITA